jgi:HSP20 family protein
VADHETHQFRKEFATMATVIPEKTKQRSRMAPRIRAVVRSVVFPFFLSRVRDEFDRLVERFTREWSRQGDGAGASWPWKVDVREENEAIVVRAEAPGLEASDFDVRVSETQLTLRATKQVETKGEDGKVPERPEQEYHWSATLPSDIDQDRIEANCRNGILIVTLPKTAEGKGKQIPVKCV